MSRKLNEWVREVHDTARAKGWWERPREDEEIYQLFVTEVAEASECARNDEPPIHFGEIVEYRNSGKVPMIPGAKIVSRPNGKVYITNQFGDRQKPEGEAIELVDLLIRIGDYFGSKGWDLGKAVGQILNSTEDPTFSDVVQLCLGEDSYVDEKGFSERPLSNHFDIVRAITGASMKRPVMQPMSFALAFIITICYMVHKEWNVEEAIEIKMAYNFGRSYRHGGKLA